MIVVVSNDRPACILPGFIFNFNLFFHVRFILMF